MNGVAVGVFIFLFLLVTVLGFAAARWRRAESLDSLDEWGLGGRGFGTFIAWFLIGGDIYTAYTFIAVPATLYAGSAVGFFAVPYTIVVYPLIFLFLPRLWSVLAPARLRHARRLRARAATTAGRWRSAVAVTGILATMPYIALQLVGMQVVLEVMGIGTEQRQLVRQGPAAVHRVRRARGVHLLLGPAGAGADRVRQGHADLHRHHRRGALPALAARRLGPHLRTAPGQLRRRSTPRTPTRSRPATRRRKGAIPPPAAQWAYASLALGSALALFMYPHSVTGVLSTRSRSVIRRNAALLPAYSFLLGLLALLGFVAIAAGVKVDQPAAVGAAAVRERVPAVVRRRRLRGDRDRRAGAGGDHVDRGGEPVDPQHLQGLHQAATPPTQQEATQSKLVSLLVKFGALVFVLALSNHFAINLQLLGGVWILQTLPAIVIGLYTRWFHRWALLAGWAVGMAYGTWLAYGVPMVGDPGSHFGGPLVNFPGTETKVYIALIAFLANLLVAVVLTVVLRAMKVDEGVDQTRPDDYHADVGDEGVEEELDPDAPAHA